MITQAELAEVSCLQAAEWMAGQAVHKAALKLLNRLKHGAVVEEGPLIFDPELKMVRTRKKAGAG